MTTEEQTTIDTLMELKQLLQTENEHLFQQYNHLMIRNQKLMTRIDDQQQLNDKLQERIASLEQIIDRLRQRNNFFSEVSFGSNMQNDRQDLYPQIDSVKSSIDMTQLISRWGSLAGGTVKNNPTKKRQMQILSLLYQNQKMPGMKLFIACGINGVSGARYIHALKQFGLIAFSGYRKDGFYFITDKGKKLIEEEVIPS